MRRARTLKRDVPELRQIIGALRADGESLPAIGRLLGMHHTTVFHHLQAMNVSTPREIRQFLVNRGAGL